MNKIKVINDQVLTRIVKSYEPKKLVRNEIMPLMKIATRSGKILTGGKEHLRIVKDVVNETSETPWITYSIQKSDGWSIVDHRLKNMITTQQGEELGGMGAAKISASKRVKVAVGIQSEYALSALMADDSILTNGEEITVAADKWDVYATSNPLTYFQKAQKGVFNKVGEQPNKAVISWATWNTLIYHPAILDKLGFKDNRAGTLSDSELARAMGVDKLVVGTALYNSAAKGKTPVMLPIWGIHCWFMYVNPNPSPEIWEESFGYTFYMQNERVLIDSYKVNDPKDAEWVRGYHDHDDVVVDPLAAYFLKNVTN